MLIVLEGLDGAGKTTQLNLLEKYFTEKGIKTKLLHFPRFNTPLYGDLIASFLRGEFGTNVDPRLVALLYANDRSDASSMIRAWISENNVVILDRYVYSNIAFQCAKIEDKQQREKLREWIFQMEFEYFKIPKPDISIFLDVPFDFTVKKLSEQREGADRKYLNGKDDIHESDLELQKRVRQVYIDEAIIHKNLKLIDCVGADITMKLPETIHKEVVAQITK